MCLKDNKFCGLPMHTVNFFFNIFVFILEILLFYVPVYGSRMTKEQRNKRKTVHQKQNKTGGVP